jgi:hypothetical protein
MKNAHPPQVDGPFLLYRKFQARLITAIKRAMMAMISKI